MYTAFLRGSYVSILPRGPPKSSKKSNKTYLIKKGFLMREHQRTRNFNTCYSYEIAPFQAISL